MVLDSISDRDFSDHWILVYIQRKKILQISRKKLARLNGEICPYCGKRKKGMADHIAAMHPEHSKGKAK